MDELSPSMIYTYTKAEQARAKKGFVNRKQLNPFHCRKFNHVQSVSQTTNPRKKSRSKIK